MEMEMDITRQAFQFCEMRRHLWNTGFSSQIDSIIDPRVSIFLDIQKLMFAAYVLEACGKGDYDLSSFGTKPFEFLQVEISRGVDQIRVLEASVEKRGQWQHRTVSVRELGEYILHFVDFFDWYPQDPEGRCAYPYIEVEAIANTNLDRVKRFLIPKEYVLLRFVDA